MVLLGAVPPSGTAYLSSWPYGDVAQYLIAGMFWYILSCTIVATWDSFIECEYSGENIQRYEKKAINRLIILSFLVTIFAVL